MEREREEGGREGASKLPGERARIMDYGYVTVNFGNW
jgi:hypothetical protein